MKSVVMTAWHVFILAACVSFTLHAQELERCRAIYDANVAAVLADSKAQKQAICDRYLLALRSLQEGAQRAGNLDYLIAVKQERDSVTNAAQEDVEVEIDGQFKELASHHISYQSAVKAKDEAAAEKIVDLTEKYEKALAARQVELTRQGVIDKATEVQNERKSLSARREVVWANAHVADHAKSAGPKAATSLKLGVKNSTYLIVDLSAGPSAKKYPVTSAETPLKGGWNDEYKTTRLVLRRIQPGRFSMGSSRDELGRKNDEESHKVTLTKAFYMGVFEVTQRQWELVMGTRPSFFNNAACYESRPVEMVGYNEILGSATGCGWPTSATVDEQSFIGQLRAKTGLLGLHLPTEAQWEYACRAGVNSALNTKKDLSDLDACSVMDKAGRYRFNGGRMKGISDPTQGCSTDNGTSQVGMYPPNAWGLYDMHGNVWEWCLDWYGGYGEKGVDPVGVPAGTERVLRGGSFACGAGMCRSATRISNVPGHGNRANYYGYGLRLAIVGP